MKNSLSKTVLSDPVPYIIAKSTGLIDPDFIPILTHQH
jgi:hypothetical protein